MTLPCRVITASELNGPLVLRHELGHSIMDVGEEYDGGKYLPADSDKALRCPTADSLRKGYAYFGVNSDRYKRRDALKWREFLTNPESSRIEDVRVPLQVYP